MVRDLGLDLRRTGGLPRRLAGRRSASRSPPGIDFDPVRGNRFVRLSYAGPHAAMREAAFRIKSWLNG